MEKLRAGEFPGLFLFTEIRGVVVAKSPYHSLTFCSLRKLGRLVRGLPLRLQMLALNCMDALGFVQINTNQ